MITAVIQNGRQTAAIELPRDWCSLQYWLAQIDIREQPEHIPNSECKTIIKLSDTDLLQSITNILNRLISQPDIIEMSIDTNEVGNDIRRLNMEIAHALERAVSTKKIYEKRC